MTIATCEIKSKTNRNSIGLRNALVEANQGLVVSIARKYANGSVPVEDLIQEGNLGLIQAAERFDPERGCQFSTYAVWWIRDYVSRAAHKAMRDEQLLSLDMPLGEHEGSTLAEFVPDENTLSPWEQAQKNELKELVIEMVSCLRPSERRIIELRFGLNGGREHSLQETGQISGISKERVRQIEVKALRRLRQMLRSPKLRDYFS